MESKLRTAHHKGTGRTAGLVSIREGGRTAGLPNSDESEKLEVICWQAILASN